MRSMVKLIPYKKRGNTVADQDTYLKLLSQALSDGAMFSLGVDGVELLDHLPTEVPASGLKIDTAWRMQDGGVFHLEYQSERESTLYRFLNYDVRLTTRYECAVRTVVLYHGAVHSAPSTLNLGTVRYQVENVYLAARDGDAELDVVERHLAADSWEAGDRLRLALALNMAVEDRTQTLERVLALVHRVPAPEETDLITAAVMALAESTLTDRERERLRKAFKMVNGVKNCRGTLSRRHCGRSHVRPGGRSTRRPAGDG